MKALNNQGGFTLLEMVAVIVLVGILSAVAIPRIDGFADKARKNTTESELVLLKRSVMAFQALENSIPSTLQDLEDNNYIAPEGYSTDAWGTDYSYTAATVGAQGVIASAGPDGSFGNSDDITVSIPELTRVYPSGNGQGNNGQGNNN